MTKDYVKRAIENVVQRAISEGRTEIDLWDVEDTENDLTTLIIEELGGNSSTREIEICDSTWRLFVAPSSRVSEHGGILRMKFVEPPQVVEERVKSPNTYVHRSKEDWDDWWKEHNPNMKPKGHYDKINARKIGQRR